MNKPMFKINTNYNNKLTVELINFYMDYFKNINYVDDYKNYSNALLKILYDIHSDENGVAKGFFYNLSTATFNPGTLFFRSRKIQKNDIQTIKKDISQFWAPNQERANLNRLNLKGEPMLYACPNDKILPIIETSITKNEHFLLIEYENIKNLKLRNITQFYTPSDDNVIYTSQIKELFDAMNDFVINLFTYKYQKNNESDYYKFTNGIKEELFPILDYRGYHYPSAYNKNKYNVCLNPNVENVELILKSVYHCILIGYNKKGIPEYSIESQLI